MVSNHLNTTSVSTANKPTDYNLFSPLLLVLSLKHLNTIISPRLISNLYTALNHITHTIQNSLSHIQVTSIQTAFFNSSSKIQQTHSTRSSAVVTLRCPSNPSRLEITDRSFYHQAPAPWNSLPKHLRAQKQDCYINNTCKPDVSVLNQSFDQSISLHLLDAPLRGSAALTKIPKVLVYTFQEYASLKRCVLSRSQTLFEKGHRECYSVKSSRPLGRKNIRISVSWKVD